MFILIDLRYTVLFATNVVQSSDLDSAQAKDHFFQVMEEIVGKLQKLSVHNLGNSFDETL